VATHPAPNHPAPKAVPGFCPYCGYDNPPHYKFCLSCRRRLPDILGQDLPKPGAPASAAATAGSATDSPPCAEGSPAPRESPDSAPRGRPWILLPIAIVIIVVIALVGSQLLPVYLAGHPNSNPTSPPPPGKTLTLCSSDNGSDCKGFAFMLPRNVDDSVVNTTTCDSFSSLGSGETLWMNYSSDGAIYSIVLPASSFGGASGWTQNAWGIVANSSTVAKALWFSGFASGSFSEAVTVPSGGGTYCIGWWEPASAPTSVTWLNDVNVTYG
jgi:hypothetical protein